GAELAAEKLRAGTLLEFAPHRQPANILDDRPDLFVRKEQERRHVGAGNSLPNGADQVVPRRPVGALGRREFEAAEAIIARLDVEIAGRRALPVAADAVAV